MEHLSNDYKDHPNQHENSHKLCNETGHPLANFMESQWRLRGKANAVQILASEERNKSKKAGL